ncbi:MAG: DNA primase small subunit PriS [Candidatus Methanomethylicia archaeon]|nr:DNA primase small subunit PriS [Candidatus Methanomethylicia archaeon]
MIRHLQFASARALKEYLEVKAPANAYYSSAYYDTPSAPDMVGKGWQGADLVFDIDADHIPTACKADHDTWRCLDCGAAGRGFPPAACPKCGMKKLETETWVCEECLKVAKEEAFKLIDDFMIPDFGVSQKEIEICFSGHRGYHLHILDERLRRLGSDGRREVADYVRGVGLDPRDHGFREIAREGAFLGPDMRDGGWRGRIARAIYAYISKCTEDQLRQVVKSAAVADTICRNRAKFLENIASDPPFWGGIKGYSLESVVRIALAAAAENACAIDERVTLDVKRLIRHPNTLHGKTALRAVRLDYSELESFDPLRSAVAFRGGSIKVYVKGMPRVRIGDHEAGPASSVEMEVPKAFGLYLICKGAAEPRS